MFQEGCGLVASNTHPLSFSCPFLLHTVHKNPDGREPWHLTNTHEDRPEPSACKEKRCDGCKHWRVGLAVRLDAMSALLKADGVFLHHPSAACLLPPAAHSLSFPDMVFSFCLRNVLEESSHVCLSFLLFLLFVF